MTSTKWTSRFPKLAASLRYATEQGAQQAGVAIVAKAKQLVPVETSSLQRTIRLEGPAQQFDIKYQVLAGDTSAVRVGYRYPVFYAAYVEYLNRPYLTPAANDVDLAAYVKSALLEQWT